MAKRSANGSEGEKTSDDKPICGIVMPISEIDDCPPSHWQDVLSIVQTAADKAGFKARLVSAADYAGVILKEIIQNLYQDPIVVCDVSARNPNVMFELGLRLAFDKPTILIKDDKTDYSFDTSPIEHLDYPRGLRYGTMIKFQERLAEKIRATNERARSDQTYTTFLKHFGDFKVASVDTTEVPAQQFIIEELKDIRFAIHALSGNIGRDRMVRYVDRLTPSSDGPQINEVTFDKTVRLEITGISDRAFAPLVNMMNKMALLNLPEAEVHRTENGLLIEIDKDVYRKHRSSIRRALLNVVPPAV